MLWSRRWEYVFCAQAILAAAEGSQSEPMTIADAGSGVTYFPYFLTERLSGATAVCLDSRRDYAPMFTRINAERSSESVRFIPASLDHIPLDDQSIDALACVSVLEHTSRRIQIIDELARVLRPGGLLALTFDLSLDGRFAITRADAADLLRHLADRFSLPEGFDPLAELSQMDRPEQLLSTDAVRRDRPELLPWRWPMLTGLKDLLGGRGWTGGFRSKTVYCLTGRKRRDP